ncbi:MAG: ComEA family DNA-binding protein [Candidatus Binatia bacterium]
MKKLILALLMWFAIAGSAVAAVNINTATKDELTSLKGIGEKRAQEIIDYRKKNGDFKSVDELEKVPGIGPGIMKQIRSDVSVTGKTTTTKSNDTGAKTKAVDAAKTKTMDVKKAEPAKAGEKSKPDEKAVKKTPDAK